MEFIDEILRKAAVGVWRAMPPVQPYSRKNNTAATARVELSNLWRVGTRHEILTQYNETMKRTYKNTALTIISLAGAYITYAGYLQNGDMYFALAAIVCAGLVSRFWTKAWGGYAGEWQDYENDPVRMVTHSAYVVTGGRGMM